MKKLREIIAELSLPHSIADAKERLAKGGWRELGSGMFGKVFTKHGNPFVLKLFKSDDYSYRRFLTLIRAQPDNPHFPKLHGLPMRVNDDYYAVRMEKLEGYNRNRERHREDFVAMGGYIANMAALHREVDDLKYNKNNEQVHERIKKYLKKIEPMVKDRPQLANAIDDIYNKVIKPTGGHGFDWHEGNVMWRGKVPVITDPAAYGEPAPESAKLSPASRQFQFVFDKPKTAPPPPIQAFGHTPTGKVRWKALVQRQAEKAAQPFVDKKRLVPRPHDVGATFKVLPTHNRRIYDLLIRSQGVTEKEMLAALGWKQIAVAAQAHALGLGVRKVRFRDTNGKLKTRYFGYIPSGPVVIKKRQKRLRDIVAQGHLSHRSTIGRAQHGNSMPMGTRPSNAKFKSADLARIRASVKGHVHQTRPWIGFTPKGGKNYVNPSRVVKI